MKRGDQAGGSEHGELSRVLQRNIEALLARRRAEEQAQPLREKVADRIGRFAGSMTFVVVHAAIVAIWIGMNVGILPGPRFDPTFVKLATAASVEAIFLSTFILVTQNRMASVADRRADLDLQISLLAEHELTRLIRLVAAMGRRIGVEESRAPGLGDIERDVAPDEVLDRLERAEGSRAEDPRPPP